MTADDPLADLRARAEELERRRETAPDEATAQKAADELHALLDAVADVAEMDRGQP